MDDSLLDKIITARLPELLAGNDRLIRDVEKALTGLRELERHFDRLTTEYALRLKALEETQETDGLRLTELKEQVTRDIRGLREELNGGLLKSAQARQEILVKLKASDEEGYAALVEMMGKSLTAWEEKLQTDVAEKLKESTALAKKNEARLQTHSDQFKPVAEGMDGLKWAKKYWKWGVASILTFTAIVLAVQKSVEVLGL